MKKRILALVMVLVLLVQVLPVSSMAYPMPEFGAQNATEKFENGIPMVVSHRAAWRDAPECSMLAVYNAMQMGVDVFELDIQMTSDGYLVLFHDSTITRTIVDSTGNVSSYTLAELRAMDLEMNQGNSSAHVLTAAEAEVLNSVSTYVADCGESKEGDYIHTNTLEDVLELMKENGPNTMINLDKCNSQEKFVASYLLLREYDMLGNVFIKSSQSAATMASWYAAAAEAWNAKYPEETQLTAEDVCDSVLYVYVLGTPSTDAISAHLEDNGNLVMVEICIADDEADAGMLETVEPWCKENNVAMFVNTMWSGLCSTKEDNETTWAEMLDRGYTAIQTDQPSEMSEYMQAYNNGHASTDTIEAEHFHLFNYESYGLHVAEEADSNLNKKVTGFHDGDWLRYEKVTFQGGENVITLNMQGTSNEGVLSIYLDDDLEPIAELTLSESTAYSNTTIVLNDEIEAGTHAITLAVTGMPNAGLLSVDSFTFGSAEISGSKNLEPVNVSTEVGVAPVLPNTVNAIADGLSYAMNVSWEAVPASSYAQEGTFQVLGYVNALETYVEATVTVYSITPEIAEDHLVAWFDASEGVTSSDGAVTGWTAKAGDLTATVSSGSPTLVANAIGGEAGICFDGNDALTFTLADENFWNATDAQYTVLMYVSSNSVTSGNGTTTSGASVNKGNQRTSVLWFKETGDWGGAYFEASQNEILWRYGSGFSQDRGTTYVRGSSIGQMYTATAIRKNGSTDTVFVDGESIYTYTAKSANTNRIGNVGQIGQGVNSYFDGTVCQILIYDTALTDTQIIAAQRWMAEKYADEVESVEEVSVETTATNAPVMPDAVTVTYASGVKAELGVEWENINPSFYQTLGSFKVKGTLSDGTVISANVEVSGGASFEDVEDDLLLWLSAQSLSADSTVSEWTAMNSSNIKFVQTTTDAQPTVVTDEENNILGVQFDGEDDLMTLDTTDLTDENNPLTAINGLSGLTVVIYSKPETSAATAINYNHFSSVIYMDETGGWGSLYFGTYTNGAAGRIGTGTSQYRGILYNEGSYDDYYTAVLRKNSTGLDTLTIDNEAISSVIYNSATSGSTTNRISTTSVKLGQGKIDGSIETMWEGTVSEIMIFNRSLSDAELGGVYSYLTETYGATYAASDTSFVTDIYLEQENDTIVLAAGETVQLNASVIPTSAINQKLTYSSSNTKVATVDENGLVTAVGAGYASITVTTVEGGYSGSCVIKVAASSEDSLWASIVNMRKWAEAQDESDYEDFSGMEAALEETADITADSAPEALEAAYNTLREAMMALVSLPEARENAQAELAEYRASFDDGDYREAQIAELDQIVADGNAAIEEAEDFEAISVALEEAKASLDAVKTSEELAQEEEAAAIASAAAEANASAQEAAAAADAANAAYDAAVAAAEAAEAAEASDTSAVDNAYAAVEVAQEQALIAQEAAAAAQEAAEAAAAADNSVTASEAAVAAAEAAELAKNAAAAAEAAAETAQAWQAAQEKLAEAEEKAAAAEEEAAKAEEEAAAAAEAAALADAKLQALQELNDKAAELIDAATTREQIANIAAAQSAASALIAEASSVDELPALIEAALAAMEASACPSEKFSDVAEDGWYHEAVDYMTANGYMKGVSDTVFGVGSSVTRAQLVTILYRVEGEPSVDGLECPFTDVSTGAWYADAVIWAADHGIVKGVSDTEFDPEKEITREQIVTILYRYDGEQKVSEDHLGGFTDAASVNDFAQDAMNWAIANEIVNGVTTTTLDPASTATRAQICAIVMRYLEG